MDSISFINRLNTNIEIFKSLTLKVNVEQCRWKPQPNKWSILEVIHHLYDEEKEDFRLRLNYTLEDPEKKWIPFDPLKLVIDKNYNEQNFEEITGAFFDEREKSVKWLQGLNSPNWDNTYSHPKIGKIKAGDLLSAWVTHDFLHIRQIANLHIEYYKVQSNPYKIDYALPQ